MERNDEAQYQRVQGTMIPPSEVDRALDWADSDYLEQATVLAAECRRLQSRCAAMEEVVEAAGNLMRDLTGSAYERRGCDLLNELHDALSRLSGGKGE